METKAPRFSRQVMIDHLKMRVAVIEKDYPALTRQTGTVQVEKKSPAANRAYGEWDLCVNMIEWLQEGWVPTS